MRFTLKSDSRPTYITDREAFSRAFPNSLNDEVRQLTKSLPSFKVWSEPINVHVGNEVLSLPHRLVAVPYDISKLSDIQQTMYYCLYSRSTDGYVREACLRALAYRPVTDWAAAYLFIALSDYVTQAANIVATDLKAKSLLSEFAKQNREIYDLTVARSISYWDLNRREGVEYDNYKDFPPYRLLKSLDLS